MNEMIGKIFLNINSGIEVEVIGETKDYVMARARKCIPFLKSKKDFMAIHQELEKGKGLNSFSERETPWPS